MPATRRSPSRSTWRPATAAPPAATTRSARPPSTTRGSSTCSDATANHQSRGGGLHQAASPPSVGSGPRRDEPLDSTHVTDRFTGPIEHRGGRDMRILLVLLGVG